MLIAHALFPSSYFLCLLCFIIIIIIIIITIIIVLNLFLLIIVVVKFNVLKINEDMKCVVIRYLLLRAAAVHCLSVHKSLSSVIKILMVPAGYVWMFCIQCTFFGCTGISGMRPGLAFFNLMEQECASYNNNNNNNNNNVCESTPVTSLVFQNTNRYCKQPKTPGYSQQGPIQMSIRITYCAFVWTDYKWQRLITDDKL